jgi:hypothetical protein
MAKRVVISALPQLPSEGMKQLAAIGTGIEAAVRALGQVKLPDGWPKNLASGSLSGIASPKKEA